MDKNLNLVLILVGLILITIIGSYFIGLPEYAKLSNLDYYQLCVVFSDNDQYCSYKTGFELSSLLIGSVGYLLLASMMIKVFTGNNLFRVFTFSLLALVVWILLLNSYLLITNTPIFYSGFEGFTPVFIKYFNPIDPWAMGIPVLIYLIMIMVGYKIGGYIDTKDSL